MDAHSITYMSRKTIVCRTLSAWTTLSLIRRAGRLAALLTTRIVQHLITPSALASLTSHGEPLALRTAKQFISLVCSYCRYETCVQDHSSDTRLWLKTYKSQAVGISITTNPSSWSCPDWVYWIAYLGNRLSRTHDPETAMVDHQWRLVAPSARMQVLIYMQHKHHQQVARGIGTMGRYAFIQ
jgi:hypothetical protein